MNVCIGSTAFVFACYKHNAEEDRRIETEKKDGFLQEYDHILDRINAAKPESLLDHLAWYSRTIASEAELAGVQNPTRAEIADEWLRRKLRPQDDLKLGVHNVPDAARVNEHRLQLKRMWQSIRKLHEKYPALDMRGGDLTSSSSANDDPASSSGAAKPLETGPIYDEIKAEINDGWNEIRRSDEIAHETLRQVEPLDKALCRARPGCVWSRDCDPMFKFIRQHWGLPESFPAESDAHLPFPDAKEPRTRVAVAMAAVTTEKLRK
mmetsp:Transcript_53534/g.92092  ORF Transcript_53534/g.92092 Transcript_53534/m.92092 type:complete len:265 (-) Transcript_53534:199-993(-)